MNNEQIVFVICVFAAVIAFIVYRLTPSSPSRPRRGRAYGNPGDYSLPAARLEPVAIVYRNAGGAVTSRVIRPQSVTLSRDEIGEYSVVSVTAFCLTANATRTFRLDRMMQVHAVASGEVIDPNVHFVAAPAVPAVLPGERRTLYSLRDQTGLRDHPGAATPAEDA